MRHRNKVKTLDRDKEARGAMLRNMVSSIILHEKIKTTKAKAKVVKPLVEKVITIAKKGDLTARRSLLKTVIQPKAVEKAMSVLGDRYKDRNGGCVRIIKTGHRQGDGAEMVQVELV
ncbi:50S ribosomal protein L17 [Candidatus Falkowbacteria bacterium HGW-Falkowbacteria-1]|uniref:50S ribosomal protein L17 n=1 Tax=Candidatus Falkowbacteria bacterium HGW-Falkowbacteria-1 TaxID=2013768 RepID=A0A2N2E9Q2_9BACT|nr:MAG: 50S ribosomal protein L17 [Candidatus Falkowbacteria bacterium HGW-Falkowbacteria-1]